MSRRFVNRPSHSLSSILFLPTRIFLTCDLPSLPSWHYYTCSKIWEILESSFRSENGGRRTGRWRGWRFALVEEKRTAEFASDCGSRSKKIFGPINQTSDAVGSGHDLEDKALNYYQCMRILGIPHPPIRQEPLALGAGLV